MKCEFRSLEWVDIEQLRHLRNSKNVWKYLSNAFLINELEQEEWFKKQSLDKTKQYFGVFCNNTFAGCIWYDEWDRINSSCRVGIVLDLEYRNKGIGTEIMEQFLEYLHNDLNIHRIWLFVADGNLPAIKLYKKLGFEVEGIQQQAIFRNGNYINYIMMGKING